MLQTTYFRLCSLPGMLRGFPLFRKFEGQVKGLSVLQTVNIIEQSSSCGVWGTISSSSSGSSSRQQEMVYLIGLMSDQLVVNYRLIIKFNATYLIIYCK